MIFHQKWEGVRITGGACGEAFTATVPGSIQYDYMVSTGAGDFMYSDNCRRYEALEDDAWEYRTHLRYHKSGGESVWFVCGGIDYKYDIILNGSVIYSYEGMYRPVELELTERLRGGDELCVYIYPHPKRAGAPAGKRAEADASCKPPVCYGWDFHPRLLNSGIWQDAYIETRDTGFIRRCEPSYTLDDDLNGVSVGFDIDCAVPCRITLYDADGNCVYDGFDTSFRLGAPRLWWCADQGEPYLYRWSVGSGSHELKGRLGFRRVRLLRNYGAGNPARFPKSRYDAPITLELNGRRIFMKGTNWVNPEVFRGQVTRERYAGLISLVAGANMNILRVWGGAGFCKKDFYELCDEAGIMVWQEFMLACNAYPDDEHYLSVLESEATAMIHELRTHACLVIWCGGNELFNSWSGMSDQSLPLRLLDKLCYESDRFKPFLKTSPLTGMGHGGYVFYDPERMGGDVFFSFRNANKTAYTEFGVTSISPIEALGGIIPKEELDSITPTEAWKLHHAIGALMPQSHACAEILKHYFGKPESVAQMIEQSDLLQCEGLKAAFEEARRQKPHCSAALSWCFNEPWITAANSSIVRYPAIPKPGYFAVRDALRPTLFSAGIPKFDWTTGELFRAEIWLLNDSTEAVSGSVTVSLKIGEREIALLDWRDAATDAGTNLQGAQVCCLLPETDSCIMTLKLCAANGMGSEYRLLYRNARRPQPKVMNM